MEFIVSRVFEDISNRMMAAQSFDDRWDIANDVLGELGATAVNSVAVDTRLATPKWFRSTLPADVLEAYLSEGHFEHDIVRVHALTKSEPLIWDTAGRKDSAWTEPQRAFVDFVIESGIRSLVMHTMKGRHENDIRTLAYCSDLPPEKVLVSEHLKKVQMALNMLLPWIGWPSGQQHPEFLRIPGSVLSRREAETLSHLASGHQNARIADAMGISEATVAKHLLSARQKLGAKTREQAIAIAIRDGYVDL